MPRTADDIVAQLPYLRRYARALTGSQGIGDQYVRICLEMIVEDPSLIPTDVDLRLQLFCLFHQVWAATKPTELQERALRAPASGEPIGEHLAVLPPVERQTLLLVSLEGFSFADTAYILGLSEAEARSFFNRAQEDIRRQAPASVMIIEDERIIALDIASIVEEMGHSVCGVAERENEALALARRTKPQLILADIQLKDGDSGIVAVQEILKSSEVPVIFITGFPEYLLTGRTVEPVFVITKPFKAETLKAAIAQALASLQPSAA
ncbi:MAG TPA: response regulator [Alphaproteobacteria bacterium]|jgi:CheY-like chemotaxis protein